MENLFTDNMFQEVQKYYNSHDMPRAGACMEYWLKQAQNASCWQEELTILNEWKIQSQKEDSQHERTGVM